MMINKRLIGTVAESKKYIAGNVILQWCSLAANIALMLSISRMLAELFRGSASVQLLTVTGIVVLLALAIRFFCSIGAAKMGYFSSKAVKKTLREKIYQKLLRLGNSYNEQVKTSEVVQVAVEGVDQLETYSGIENLDKWIGSLKKLLSTYAQSAKTFDEIKLDKNFKKLMGELPEDLQKMLGEAIGSVYTAQIAGDTISELTDKIERLDMYIDVVMHCFNDYSVQVSYLDGLENALAAAGFPESAVTDKIRELKETYQSDVLSYALDQVGDLVVDEVKKTAIGEIIKKAAKEFPGIKGVLWGVDWVSAAAKVQNADEISAIKGLGGLYQFDHVLTSTYENYAQMMNAGIATQADLEEAERIFTLLKQTKIQEYEHMLTLCERRDTRLFEKYHFKYYQLTGEAWNGHSLTSSWQYVGSGT